MNLRIIDYIFNLTSCKFFLDNHIMFYFLFLQWEGLSPTPWTFLSTSFCKQPLCVPRFLCGNLHHQHTQTESNGWCDKLKGWKGNNFKTLLRIQLKLATDEVMMHILKNKSKFEWVKIENFTYLNRAQLFLPHVVCSWLRVGTMKWRSGHLYLALSLMNPANPSLKFSCSNLRSCL